MVDLAQEVLPGVDYGDRTGDVVPVMDRMSSVSSLRPLNLTTPHYGYRDRVGLVLDGGGPSEGPDEDRLGVERNRPEIDYTLN